MRKIWFVCLFFLPYKSDRKFFVLLKICTATQKTVKLWKFSFWVGTFGGVFFFEEFLRSQLSYVVFYKNCNHLFERKMILIWLHPRESGVQEMQDVFWWKTWKCKLRLCRKSSKNQTFNCASELRHININFFIFLLRKY